MGAELRTSLLVAALGLAVVAVELPAWADDAGAPAPAATSVEVLVLFASNDGSGIDPKLGKMPALSQPPFSSYNSYTLLDRSALEVAVGKPNQTKLPTGRELRVALKSVVEPEKKGDPRRFVVNASIQKADGSAFLPLLEVSAKAGEPVFVAGQDYKGGSLVIGLKVVP